MSEISRRQFLAASASVGAAIGGGSSALAGQIREVQLEGNAGQNFAGFGSISPDLKRCGWYVTDDRAVKVWDTQTGKLLATLKGVDTPAKAVAFSPDGKRIAAVHKTPVVWDWAGQKRLLTLPEMSGTREEVAFSPDGKSLAVPAGSAFTLFDGTTGEVQFTFKAEPRPLREQGPDGDSGFWCCAFSPDGRRVAAGTWGGRVFVFAVPGGVLERTLAVRTRVVRSLRWSADGKAVIGGCHHDGGIVFWDAATGDQRLVLPIPDGKTAGRLTPSPDGKLLAVGWLDTGGFDLVDITARKARFQDTPGNLQEVSFAADRAEVQSISVHRGVATVHRMPTDGGR